MTAMTPPSPLPDGKSSWKLLWHYATSHGVPVRSLKVALVVGTALNLINQGDALFGAAAMNWWKVVLTFAMPYAVSTYGAVAAQWDTREVASRQA